MNTVTQRILLTVFGVPIFLSSIFFLPQGNYAVLNCIILIFSIAGSYEISKILSGPGPLRSIIHPILPGLLPATAYIQLYLIPEIPLVAIAYVLVFAVMMSIETITGAEDQYAGSIGRITRSLFHLIYPSWITIFVIRLTAAEDAQLFIIFWFLMIFSNDVFAYVFGMLFGKNSVKPFAVSPNKSVVGYLGGSFVTLLNSYLFYTFIPAAQRHGTLLMFLLTAAGISLLANIGDLIESALKRSSNKKDSGTIIPGRGGVLDTIDSIIFSAPAFYYILLFIFKVV